MGEFEEKDLVPPLKECPWCRGYGHEYVDCMNELSGYDYRYPCRCRIRHIDFTKKEKNRT